MRIESAEFVLSAAGVEQCPPGPRVEIAMSGRSNVGKSSLLNSLLGRRTLAKVSSTPGKTRLLNYFLVNGRFHLVDLPGYGYARASGEARAEWSRAVQGYLQARQQLAAVIQLVDSRHEPSRDDHDMIQWLRDEGLPFCLVATKIDKLRSGQRMAALRAIVGALELPEARPLVPYSSRTGEGREALLAWIGDMLESRPEG